MTTTDDLKKMLEKKNIQNVNFYYIDYKEDIYSLFKLIQKSKIKHNIVMILGNNNKNHWIYINFDKGRFYYFDSYGVIPNTYQLLDDFKSLKISQIYEKRSEILDKLVKQLDRPLYFNDYILQKNPFGLIQSDVDGLVMTTVCGQFCVLCAYFMESLPKYLEDPSIYILTCFNTVQSHLNEPYDEVVKKIV